MRFWDSSAILPLTITEPTTAQADALLAQDPNVVVWWGTSVECYSGLHRRLRDHSLTLADWQTSIVQLEEILADVLEIQPALQLRRSAQRLLALHQLRAADSLQLAAALTWAGERPEGQEFVCFDQRLRTAAQLEGFAVLP